MGRLWRRKYGREGNSELKEVHPGEIGDVNLSRPTLVYFPGFRVMHRDPRRISGSIKALEKLLGGGAALYEQLDIYGASYTGYLTAFNLFSYNSNTDTHRTQAAQDFVENVFLSAIAKNGRVDRYGHFTGERRPIQEVRRRFQNLTLLGHSFGTIVAQSIHNVLKAAMLELGYTDKEVVDLVKEIVLIGIGNATRPIKEADRFTTLAFAGTTDRPVRLKDFFWQSGDQKLSQKPDALTITALSERCLYITTRFKNGMHKWKKVNDVWRHEIVRNLVPKWVPFNSMHETDYYVTQVDSENGFSRMVAHALRNAVTRTGTPDVNALLRIAPPIVPLAEDAPLDPNITHPFNEASYREQILAAMKRGTLEPIPSV